MITECANRLVAAQDKFAFLLSEAVLYQLSRDPALVAELRSSPALIELSPADLDSIDLAIAFVMRRHVDLKHGEALKKVSEIQARMVAGSPSIVRARITRAAILFTSGRLLEARNEFFDCMAISRESEDHFAFAVASKGFGDAAMFLGDYAASELAYQDAQVTFRRYDYELMVAFVTNNLGVLKKRLCEYGASLKLLSQARRTFQRLGADVDLFNVTKNLGLVCARLGEWKAAKKWLAEAAAIHERVVGLTRDATGTEVAWGLATPLPHLLAMQRKFAAAEKMLLSFSVRAGQGSPQVVAVIHEFLGELYCDAGSYERASYHLNQALAIASTALPASEQMGEILRRQAQLAVCQRELDLAREISLRCIKLVKKVGDLYEFGAALRILGEVYAAQKNAPKAAACFRAAVHTLKSIHECYELMRALHAQGKFLATTGKQDEAEIALLEARQLSKKLELEYYQALIAIAMVDTIGPQERFEEAQSWVAEATSLRDHLEGIDRERVEAELKRSANDLQTLITRASVKSAETLKTICRVYEDARFPFEDMRADLAYQVAQSINAESLFVVGKSGTGFRVPITYNISQNESKEIVRRLERILKSKTLLNVVDEPQILTTIDSRTLLAVPCRENNDNPKARKNVDRFVACARFEAEVHPGPRQIELMCASAEALARIIEEDDLRPGRKPAAADDAGDDTPEIERVTHPHGSFKSILTIDPEMIKLIRTAERAAGSVAPILLEGETGVGKELFARAIHGSSQRKDGPFVAINAGGMSVHLLESELFGHVRGAFTDAGNDRVGLVDTARGGTLFFDEVGEMGEEMQVKLLRLMENGEYRRLGESSMRKADVRVISATNRDLKKDAERGLFRRDLYYRLSPLKLTVPPLRLRVCDIQLLTRCFLRECAAMNGIADRYIEIDVKAMEALEVYDWPGNVRELHNEILRVVSLIGRGDLVRFAMLSDGIKDFLKTNKRGEGLLDRSVEQYERRLILDALEKNDWNKLRTADAIGIPRTTLLAKLRRMNIASKI